MKENNAMSRYSKTMSDTMAEVKANEKKLLEVSPPGFKGTVKAMKKHDDIDNPYALAWHMKNKGDEAHYKSKDGKPEKKEKFKEEDDIVSLDHEEIPRKLKLTQQGLEAFKQSRDVEEANLPPHLAKFFDKKGNPKPEVAKRMSDAAKKKKVVSKDVTPKGYGPNEDVEMDEGGAYGGGLKDASKNLQKAKDRLGLKVKSKTTSPSGVTKTTYHPSPIIKGMITKKEDVDNIHAEALRENGIVEEVEWKVQLRGLPIFYVPAKSAGEVRAMLRRQIKKPDDIVSIERSTKAAKKKDFRDRVSGKESDS